MENQNKNEIQALLNLNCRMLALENLAANYKDNNKALKLCLKLIKLECKDFKTCNAVSAYKITELQHKYKIFEDIIKRIIKSTANHGAKNKAVSDLHTLIEQTREYISELNEQLNPLSENVRKLAQSIDGTAKKLSEKLESGTKILSKKISEAVDGIKKSFKDNEEN